MDAHQQELLGIFKNYCSGKTVIEIGSCDGYITEPLSNAGSEHLTCVEPNAEMCGILEMRKNWFSREHSIEIPTPLNINQVICDTANDFYSTDRLADVVVCFGVLYHLHSPLHLLELIVNKSKPSTVILEPMHYWTDTSDAWAQNTLKIANLLKEISLPQRYAYERFNEPGSAQTDKSIGNPLKIALHADASLFITAMKLLGYSYSPHNVLTRKGSNSVGEPGIIGIFTKY